MSSCGRTGSPGPTWPQSAQAIFRPADVKSSLSYSSTAPSTSHLVDAARETLINELSDRLADQDASNFLDNESNRRSFR
ncbi:hypothetical protein F6X37_35895 [Paraburkholderia sp. 31.1]|nr:hypothetical protein [Paraburkholderia sp. 31.1]